MKVLFIDACIRREHSRTRQLAEAFLAALQQHKAYEIERLTLMDEGLNLLSEGFFWQREDLIAGRRLDHPRFRYARQFQQADRVVIAAPFWDLSFPAILKVYIENICVDGITFHTDESGLRGLCRAERMLYLTTRGGDYSASSQEMGVKYLQALSEFWGIPRFDHLAADGLDLGLELPQVILASAIRRAETLAETF